MPSAIVHQLSVRCSQKSTGICGSTTYAGAARVSACDAGPEIELGTTLAGGGSMHATREDKPMTSEARRTTDCVAARA